MAQSGAAGAPRGSLKPADMFHRAGYPDSAEAEESMRIEAEAKVADEEHEKEVSAAEAYWSQQARAKKWDCIEPDLSVYRYSTAKDVKEDPRRTDEYREAVLRGLGFAPDQTKPDLTVHDMAACREVLWRNAGAFWIEDTPRTALRYLQHDTIPTGPPVRTPPHRLKGEEADWVDSQLQKEVISGQLIRGNSEWASPPFATKSFAEHRRQRKRRLVVDYRRVNSRVLRAVYFVRSADGVVAEVAGSMWMSFVDACKGFNQVANTRRAREMLAILSRSGQYLPVCLTFGPTNGPEDFAFATDRVFAPGRGRKMRFCSNWQIYADDITVRSGRWLDGTYYSDQEYADRVRTAVTQENESQPFLDEAFQALGFNTSPLGAEKGSQDLKPPHPKAKSRSETSGEKGSKGLNRTSTGFQSPFAHLFLFLLQFGFTRFLLTYAVWIHSLMVRRSQMKQKQIASHMNGIKVSLVLIIFVFVLPLRASAVQDSSPYPAANLGVRSPI